MLMMGSKEEDVPVEPTEKVNFIEDMTEAERNSAVSAADSRSPFALRKSLIVHTRFPSVMWNEDSAVVDSVLNLFIMCTSSSSASAFSTLFSS